ncbi:ABC transporter permease [Amycolatopsis magusensis]|uniref:NitT/TauT family transport system permease protein n=1 Tax=Amycolatopsis magusensis TaxID=882444 RepID=A0ABS4Q4D0_9PSEU|nr:ABC transporter permease [Amycolatopsis magusensis]MBP2186537.1 NitT/TauT family transport system permease protein [Amycolatopsis magusensis]
MVTRTPTEGLGQSVGDSPGGVTERARPGAGDRFVRFLERSWRPFVLLALLFAGWWAITAAELVEPFEVASPGVTLETILAKPDYFLDHAWTTTYETLLGFVIATVIGVFAAVIMVYSSTIEKSLYPLLLFAQVIPKIAVAPLFVVWLGFGLGPKVIVAVLMAFFPVVISMVTGLKSIDPEMLELSATMGAKPWQTFWKIRFPASLPHLFSGLKVAATMAVTGAVVGEFVGSEEGLGFIIQQANGNFDTPTLFAGLVIISLMGVLLFLIVEWLEALVLPWHASRRSDNVTTTL